MATTCNSYLVPAGKIYWEPCGQSGGFYFGQTPGGEIAVDTKTTEIYDSDNASGDMIGEWAHSTAREISLKCISPSDNILALFFEADASTLSQSSGSVTDESIAGVKQGYHYQLGRSSTNPTGVRSVSAVTVSHANGANAGTWASTTAVALNAYKVPTTANTYYYKATVAGTTGSTEPTWPTTVGGTVTDGSVTWTCVAKINATVTTDYTVNADLGDLFIVVGGGIAEGETLLVDYTKAAASRTQHKATLNLNARLSGSLRFVADNVAAPNRDIYIPLCVLRPDGAATIKRNQQDSKVTEFGFKAKAQRQLDSEGAETIAALYIDGRAVA